MKINHFKENKENSISFYSRTPLKKTSEALAHLDTFDLHTAPIKSNKEKYKHRQTHIVGWKLHKHINLHYIIYEAVD